MKIHICFSDWVNVDCVNPESEKKAMWQFSLLTAKSPQGAIVMNIFELFSPEVAIFEWHSGIIWAIFMPFDNKTI